MRSIRLIKKIYFFIFIFLISVSVFPDDVTLKNNKVIEKVKTKISIDKVAVIYLDNKLETYLKRDVRSVRLKPIIINNPVTEKDKIENEKEKIRVAESLQDVTGLEIPENQKLKVAVLNFKTSTSISKEEADIIVETITVELVKTKLFVIIDPILLKQVMNEKGGAGCGDNPANCKIPASQIAKSINIEKVITGTVNKIKNSYYINGNVVDTNSNNIDFAESSLSTSFEKIPETSGNFSKKIAGGLMSNAKVSINLNQDNSEGFFSRLFKSNSGSEKKLEEKESVQKGSSRYPYLFRSALIPGWGQFANDRKLKGAFLFGIFAIGAGFEIYSYNRYRAALNDYSDARDNFILNTALTNANAANLAFYLNYKNLAEERNQIDLQERSLEAGGAALAVIYLYNLFDSYYFYKDKTVFDYRKDFTPKFSAMPMKDSFGQSSMQYVFSLESRF
ncbi:MAG: DUF5683 domain-containing protein [Leptospiraceae bacterium]|nr:DUF5683 domain-containing protein [Leptospiraceae bacterium]